MTIHRTRQGSIPSGGPEPGRTIVQMGQLFVEYSGAVPSQAELDAHLNPPVDVSAVIDAEVVRNPAFRALLDVLTDKPAFNAANNRGALIAAMKGKA